MAWHGIAWQSDKKKVEMPSTSALGLTAICDTCSKPHRVEGSHNDDKVRRQSKNAATLIDPMLRITRNLSHAAPAGSTSVATAAVPSASMVADSAVEDKDLQRLGPDRLCPGR